MWHFNFNYLKLRTIKIQPQITMTTFKVPNGHMCPRAAVCKTVQLWRITPPQKVHQDSTAPEHSRYPPTPAPPSPAPSPVHPLPLPPAKTDLLAAACGWAEVTTDRFCLDGSLNNKIARDVHLLIPRTCDYVTLHGKGTLQVWVS